MRILYVTPAYTGAKDIILNKSDSFSGLPPFVKMIEGLRAKGYKIDFIIVDRKEKEESYINKSNIVYSEWNNRGLKRITSIFRAIININRQLKSESYNFVYGHGSIGILANIMARVHKIATGQRLYGAYPLLVNINKGKSKLSLFIKQPLYYLSFKLKKDFLIVTNDGTKGDLVFKTINKNNNAKFPFKFWTNGVDLLEVDESYRVPDDEFILYPGRIDSQKQTLKALEVAEKLKMKKIRIKIYFAGSDEFAYAKKVRDQVKSRQLEDYVCFLGSVSRKGMGYLYKNSIATLLLYDVSNKGNTALEALKTGSILVTYNNTGLNDLIVNNESGFLVRNTSEATEILEKIVNKKVDIDKIKQSAENIANEKLESWEERVHKEINLIEKVVRKNIDKELRQ